MPDARNSGRLDGSDAMPGTYEFHVAGLIGPVVRAALPELTASPVTRHSVLTGAADGPEIVEHLLCRLTEQSLVASHIVIARGSRWTESTSPPD